MPRAAWAVIAVALTTAPAVAVITRVVPLREVLAAEQFIFVATVESLDRDRPAAVLAVADDLKGKAPVRRWSLSLTGDAGAQREKQTAQLLDRLAPKLPMVVFASVRGPKLTAYAYTDGTWFQFTGPADAKADAPFAFAHLEPYLRRTFKGPTAALRHVVVDGLAGRKAPPEPDANEPPGIGPPVRSAASPGSVRIAWLRWPSSPPSACSARWHCWRPCCRPCSAD
jgi:hypothetical protein